VVEGCISLICNSVAVVELFEAFVLKLAQHMTFAAVARIVGESWHRVTTVCRRYVDLGAR
jgi:Helix-turn-helix domain of transposase family ISL3